MITVIIQASNIGVSFEKRNKSIIDGKQALSFLINRLTEEKDLDIVLCTSDRPEDDDLELVAHENQIKLFRGDYSDVLRRIADAVNECKCTDFVRVFANYPLIDICELKKLYVNHVRGGYDYSYNEHNEGVLLGTGCEVFSVNFLNTLCLLELDRNQRETISYYVRQNNRFNIYKRKCWDKRPGYKVNLDTEKDLEVINEIVNNIEIMDNLHIKEYFDSHFVLSRYNLESPPIEIEAEKIFLHPRKVEKFLKAEPDLSFPICVTVSLTNRNNVSCASKYENSIDDKKESQFELQFEVFKTTICELKAGGTLGIVFGEYGEPTIYEHFSEAVKCVYENELGVGMITDGIERVDLSVVDCFDWIRVNLDASTAEEYYKLKNVDLFETVISNIVFYAKHCKDVEIGYVVTGSNISQVESIVLRLREIGVSNVRFSINCDGNDLYPGLTDLSYLKFYMNKNFRIVLNDLKKESANGNAGLPCVISSIASSIAYDGNVYICESLGKTEWMVPIGNLYQQTYREIWFSEERLRQLAVISDSEFCNNNCPRCRISKFNLLIDRIKSSSLRCFI